MSAISIRACICRPAFWILTGTVMLPMNLIFALGFWLRAKTLRADGLALSARSLNVQLTYTIVFLLPIFLAELFSSPALGRLFPGGALRTLIVGFVFGMIGLAGVIVLIFSNTRAFAGDLLGHPVTAPSRFKFVHES